MREVTLETLIRRRHVEDFPNQRFLELRQLKDRNTMTATTASNGTGRRGEHKNFDDPFQNSDISRPTKDLLIHATDDQPNPRLN